MKRLLVLAVLTFSLIAPAAANPAPPPMNEEPGAPLLTCDAQHMNAQYYWGGWWLCTFDPGGYRWVFVG